MRDFFEMYYMPGGTNGVDENGNQIIIDDWGERFILKTGTAPLVGGAAIFAHASAHLRYYLLTHSNKPHSVEGFV